MTYVYTIYVILHTNYIIFNKFIMTTNSVLCVGAYEYGLSTLLLFIFVYYMSPLHLHRQ